MALLSVRKQYLAVRTVRDLLRTTDRCKFGCGGYASNVIPKRNKCKVDDTVLKAEAKESIKAMSKLPKLSDGDHSFFVLSYKECRIADFIIKKLQAEPTHVLYEIWKHPKKRYIKLSQVKQTLMFLQQLGFLKPVIAESPAICFYPVANIMEGFKEIDRHKSELHEIGFENGFIGRSSSDSHEGSVTKDKRLELCIYYMELPFSFNGSGIFDTSSKHLLLDEC